MTLWYIASLAMLSLAVSLVTLMAMWRLREFAAYLAYHVLWLSGLSILTVVVVVMFRYHENSCNCAIAVVFLTRGYDVISFLLRMTDASFARRIFDNIKSIFKTKRKVKGAPLMRANSSESSLFRTKYSGGFQKLGGQDISGVFQSLSVKVRPRQFILDSLITLSLFQCRKISDLENGDNSNLSL